MEHKIVISGEGSAHPKLGVKKKNSVEENLKILNDMIESGKLSLDHAIAKTKSNGTLRGIFKCSEDEEMAAHVDALYDFVVAYKKRLVPDFDPAAPVQKVQKEAVGFPPVVEAAKSGRSSCKISQEKHAAYEKLLKEYFHEKKVEKKEHGPDSPSPKLRK